MRSLSRIGFACVYKHCLRTSIGAYQCLWLHAPVALSEDVRIQQLLDNLYGAIRLHPRPVVVPQHDLHLTRIIYDFASRFLSGFNKRWPEVLVAVSHCLEQLFDVSPLRRDVDCLIIAFKNIALVLDDLAGAAHRCLGHNF